MLDRMFMGAAADDKLFVEDVFSTYLYDGNSTARNIVNGVDLAGKGGMVWIKTRTTGGAGWNHVINDTVRGPNKSLFSNTTGEQLTSLTNMVTGFNADGFSLGSDANSYLVNQTGYGGYVSWTFREAPKFFDVVTWNGNDAYGRTISHNLGVAPGCIIIKHTSGPYASGNNWVVWHRSDPANVLALNTTGAAEGGSNKVLAAGVTATSFQLGGDSTVNRGDGTYVAYLFAHDATSDGIIQCGSFTTDGSANATVNLGYEPQWLLLKRVDAGSNWMIMDNMRGLNYSAMVRLFADSSSAESNTSGDYVHPTATGFELVNSPFAASATYVYIAIRRGPMRTPTLGTSVFSPIARTGSNLPFESGQKTAVTGVGFSPDAVFSQWRSGNNAAFDRLRGGNKMLVFTNTSAEDTPTDPALISFDSNGYTVGPDSAYGYINFSTRSYINWVFKRAPGFFDEVCYTGTGSAGTITHNLGVVPELVITKGRGSVTNWGVYTAALGPTKALLLNGTNSEITSANYWNNTAPTATQVSLGATTNSSTTFVAYLFASCAGVSKVGSYTGNGSSQTINCGFAAGARFVMIKRTDSTGDWYVWDTARGIVAGNDPYLRLNLNAAEVTTDDTIDPNSTGFVVNQVAATNVNVSSATYIYLAIA